MTDEEKFEIGAGPVKVAASGTSVGRIGGAIADLLSPFSQGFGLVGDHIRLYRERSVRRVLERAAEIARDRGEPVSPVNPKNLVPLLEDASMEDADESELIEVWAKLLLSGGAQFDSELSALTDSLKRIGLREVRLLQTLGQITDGSSAAIPHLFGPKNRKLVGILADKKIPKGVSGGAAAQYAQDAMAGSGLSFGKVMRGYFEYEGSDEEDYDGPLASWFVAEDGTDIEAAAAILQREGLVEVIAVQEIGTMDFMLSPGQWLMIGSSEYVELTHLGIALLRRCSDEFSQSSGLTARGPAK